ncbi:hypothetical protein RB213_016192 [Colletotrichum asianum]
MLCLVMPIRPQITKEASSEIHCGSTKAWLVGWMPTVNEVVEALIILRLLQGIPDLDQAIESIANASLVPPAAADEGAQSRESEGFRTEKGSEMAEIGFTHAGGTSSGFKVDGTPSGADADENPFHFDRFMGFGP